MELKEIMNIQKKFDEEYFSQFWKIENDSDFLDRLQYLVVALTGEVGEFSNIVKKMIRDYRSLKAKPEKKRLKKLREELTDCFIYLMILGNLLKIDFEKEYFKKLKFNKKRFENYK